ncbi:MAG: DUF2339 domain-containing protein [Oscillospiraceae bacterium]
MDNPQNNINTPTQQNLPDQSYQPNQQLPPNNAYIPPVQPVQPAAPTNTSSEFVIGINVISKIGVIFIIIGIIAFSVVAAPVLNGIVISLIIYSAGIVLGVAGEFFYRRGNKVFSRALTLGCIAEAFITTLISSIKLDTFSPIAAAFISLLIAAGGIALSFRYKSQTILSVTAVSGMIMVYAIDKTLTCGVIMMIYLLLLQTALVIVSIRNKYIFPASFALALNVLAGIQFCSRLGIDVEFGVGIMGGVGFGIGFSIGIIFIVITYIILSFSIYTAAAIVCEFRNIPIQREFSVALLISAAAFKTIFTVSLLWNNFDITTAGAAALVMAIIYIILAIISHLNSGESILTNALKVISVLLVLLANYTLLIGRYAYISAHIIGAALFVFGIVKYSKLFRNCGIAALIFAQLNFWLISLVWSSETIYYIQYSLNIVIWVGLMIFLAHWGCKGKLFTAYIITVYCTCSFYVIFLVSRLMDALNNSGVISAIERDYSKHYYAAVIFMLLAFLLARRKALGKASVIASEIVHISALLYLGIINLCLSSSYSFNTSSANNIWASIACIIACTASVFAALDLVLTFQRQNPKFSKAVGMIISGYAVITATYLLGVNEVIAFTSCIISVMYIVLATAWIVIGFLKNNPLLRRCGLALVLFSCAKLFLFDFSNIDNIGRTVMFIGFGIALLCISMIYGFFEAKMRKK